MRNFLIILFIFLLNNSILANEITVIDLHNKSLDQLSKELELNQNEKNKENILIEGDLIINNQSTKQDNLNLESNSNNNLFEDVSINEVYDYSEMWGDLSKEDLNFLLNDLNLARSATIRKELISILNINESVPKSFDKEDFNKLLINSLLSLGARKKSYELIQNFDQVLNTEYNIYYIEFNLNYLLSIYDLSGACEYRNEIKNLNSNSTLLDNYFLKVDIFCLLLQEKFDEANLLNSLLDETTNGEDQYFQYLYNKLQNIEIDLEDIDSKSNPKNIFLYSAMHRIGNIPLSNNFLNIDPLNLSMPIVLSGATNIDLRLRAAHLAYFNKLLNIDSLAALYQIVDFSYDELNEPSKMKSLIEDNVEIGMAYFYQLINVQLLPITRLEAIVKFWEYAEKNDLELIAYKLSIKSLNTIEPSNELIAYGPKIAKAYIYSSDTILANKWILFSENSLKNKNLIYDLNASKLLYNLINIEDEENLTNVLFDSLNYMEDSLIDVKNPDNLFKKEILHIIFSILNENIENLYKLEKKINEDRPMPSIYLINKIRNSIVSKNYPEFLLYLVISTKNMNWVEIHPEHLRIILLGLKEYRDGLILNDILLEILKNSKII